MTKAKIRTELINYYNSNYEPELEDQWNDNSLIDVTIMRDCCIKLDVALYVGLREYNYDSVWNELRKGDTILDWDAPNQLTLKEWVDYFSSLLILN